MLIATQDHLSYVFAIPHSQPQRDVVAGAKLVHEPADAMSLIAGRVFMAGHCRLRKLSHHVFNTYAWLCNRARQPAMFDLAVAVRDVTRVS